MGYDRGNDTGLRAAFLFLLLLAISNDLSLRRLGTMDPVAEPSDTSCVAVRLRFPSEGVGFGSRHA
jgi:hypothetical protein